MADIRPTVLADLVERGFPVDPKPYCAIGSRLDFLEGDVLEAVLGMRMDGTIVRLGATFSGQGCAVLSDDEMALVDRLSGDLPMSEDPYAELAAELARMGIEADEDWVLQRTSSWLEGGVIVSVGATIGD